MATPILMPAEDLRQLALDCVEDAIEQLEKVFAVTSGGAALATRNQSTTEATIFSCIEDIVESHDALALLREHIDRLAALAAANSMTEASHV